MSYIPEAMRGHSIDRALAIYEDAVNSGLSPVASGVAIGVHGALTNAFDASMYKIVSAKPLSPEMGMSPLNLNSGVSTSRGFHAVQ